MAVATPLTTTLLEDLVHVGNPTKHKAITLGADVDVTDPTVLGGAACGLYVGTTGDVVLTDRYGTSVKYVAVPAGSYIPLVFVGIVNSGTTASNLVVVGK